MRRANAKHWRGGTEGNRSRPTQERAGFARVRSPRSGVHARTDPKGQSWLAGGWANIVRTTLSAFSSSRSRAPRGRSTSAPVLAPPSASPRAVRRETCRSGVDAVRALHLVDHRGLEVAALRLRRAAPARRGRPSRPSGTASRGRVLRNRPARSARPSAACGRGSADGRGRRSSRWASCRFVSCQSPSSPSISSTRTRSG